jgi:uncharacterized protein (DUF2147 family)
MIKRISAFVRSPARLVAGIAVLVWASPSYADRPELGVWYDASGDGGVEVYICQDNANRLCGRIVWLKNPLNDQGVPKHDRHNPKSELQNRPICGLPIFGNLALQSDGTFDGGWIYDPKVGKTYDVAMQMTAPDKLVITGYLTMKLLGKSFTWTRAPGDLQRCEGAPPPPT